MIARFAGKCARCGGEIQAGEEILYDRETKKARHSDVKWCQLGVAFPKTGGDEPKDQASEIADKLGYK